MSYQITTIDQAKVAAMHFCTHPKVILAFKFLCFALLLLMSLKGFAGKDLAAGAADDLIATEKGTGIKIAYGIEFVVAVGAAILKRSISAFFWIFGIAIFSTFVFGHFLA